MKYWIPCLLMLFSSIQALYSACGDIIYVHSNASGLKDGSSWDNAYVILQDALDAAFACSDIQEIWVGEGIYPPTVDIAGSTSNSIPQNRTYIINDNILMYGGFAGYESHINQRIKYLYPSVLSGDQNGDDVYINAPDSQVNILDNSFNIMRVKNLNSSTIIDGFVFQGGNAVSTSSTLSKKIGAAIFNDGRGVNNESTPIISNCSFLHCHSKEGGGAIYNFGTNSNPSPQFINCDFKYNSSDKNGGAVYNLADGVSAKADQSFENCVFLKNLSSLEGGAVHTDSDNGALIGAYFNGCTFSRNEAARAAGIMTRSETPNDSLIIINSTFYLNQTFEFTFNQPFDSEGIANKPSYSNFPGVIPFDGNNNFSGDPQFIGGENVRLQPSSPLIGAGEPPGPPVIGGNEELNLDIDGNSRIMGGRRDIGAYEFLSCPVSNTIYVNDDQTQFNPSGRNLSCALRSLNAALEMACHCPEKPTIYVSDGTYIPHRSDNMQVPTLSRRFSTYSIDCPVNLYGGQPNSVLVTSTEKSILDADFLQNDQSNNLSTLVENAHTIMSMFSVADGSIIEGFIFRNGNNEDFFFLPQQEASALDISILTPGTFSLNVSNCEFRRNRNLRGGTIDIFTLNGESSISFENCEIRGNDASRGAAIDYNSNGNGNCNLSLTECIIQGNDAIESPNFSKESPFYYGSSTNGNDELVLLNCEFEENDGSEEGGGLSINLSGSGNKLVEINECEFIDNEADEGGAISLSSIEQENIIITNTLFRTNDALSGGGGAVVVDLAQESECDIRNCVFVNNDCRSSTINEGGGGAVMFKGSTNARIINSTFISNYSNNSKGGAFFNAGDQNVTIYNSLFWSNRSEQESTTSVESISGSTVELNHCLIEEESCQEDHMTGVSCSSSLFNEDPLIDFNLGIRRYSTMVFSPANGAGNNAVVNDIYDFVGSRYDPNNGPYYRIKNNTVDIGAFEHQGVCVDELTLDPVNDFYLGGELNGAWSADSKIVIKGGFTTQDSIHLILDAPEVILEGGYEFLSQNTMEVFSVGCN